MNHIGCWMMDAGYVSTSAINSLGQSIMVDIRSFLSGLRLLNFAKQLDDDQKMAEAIAEFPKIMERPIAVKGDKAVIGRPPENVLSLLS
jgi:arsenate reductase